jgi:DNA-binding MarR family transcriptional regulator
MNHYLLVVLIITGCGLFGGLINYFRTSVSFGNSTFSFLKSLLTGLGASALVPLLLKMISSDLLVSSKSDPIDYFVIGGFCLISAIFSSKFIDSIGEKLINQIDQVTKDVKEVKDDLDELSTESEFEKLPEFKQAYEGLDGYEKEILMQMYQSKYTYRSVGGIAAEIYLDKEQTLDLLNGLELKKCVRKSQRKNNVYRWRLTDTGREIIAEKFDDESSC